jgi:hypothetical protein
LFLEINQKNLDKLDFLFENDQPRAIKEMMDEMDKNPMTYYSN